MWRLILFWQRNAGKGRLSICVCDLCASRLSISAATIRALQRSEGIWEILWYDYDQVLQGVALCQRHHILSAELSTAWTFHVEPQDRQINLDKDNKLQLQRQHKHTTVQLDHKISELLQHGASIPHQAIYCKTSAWMATWDFGKAIYNKECCWASCIDCQFLSIFVKLLTCPEKSQNTLWKSYNRECSCEHDWETFLAYTITSSITHSNRPT